MNEKITQLHIGISEFKRHSKVFGTGRKLNVTQYLIKRKRKVKGDKKNSNTATIKLSPYIITIMLPLLSKSF